MYRMKGIPGQKRTAEQASQRSRWQTGHSGHSPEKAGEERVQNSCSAEDAEDTDPAGPAVTKSCHTALIGNQEQVTARVKAPNSISPDFKGQSLIPQNQNPQECFISGFR